MMIREWRYTDRLSILTTIPISRMLRFSGIPASLIARIAYREASAGPLSSLVPRPYIRFPSVTAPKGG